MEISIKRMNQAVHLEASNEDKITVQMDGSEKIGGENLGVRPMQMVLMALGGCSSMDVLSILKKMKQQVDDYEVKVLGSRDSGAVPSVFTGIHVHFILKGDIEEAKAAKAIKLSLEKYCSVAKMLEKTAKISYDFELNP